MALHQYVLLYFLTFSAIISKVEGKVNKKWRLTIYTGDGRNWNSCAKFCEANGGQLIVFDEVKYHVIQEFTTGLWKDVWGDDYWIGLYIKDDTFMWHGDCENEADVSTWAVWDSTPEASKHCVLLTNDLKWEAIECYETEKFMCEFNLGDCTYDNITASGSSTSCTYNMNLTPQIASSADECKQICQTWRVGGKDCWAVTYDLIGQNCYGSFGFDPYDFRESAACPTSNLTLTSLYYRNCFEGSIESTSAPTYSNTAGESEPLQCSLSDSNAVETPYISTEITTEITTDYTISTAQNMITSSQIDETTLTIISSVQTSISTEVFSTDVTEMTSTQNTITSVQDVTEMTSTQNTITSLQDVTEMTSTQNTITSLQNDVTTSSSSIQTVSSSETSSSGDVTDTSTDNTATQNIMTSSSYHVTDTSTDNTATQNDMTSSQNDITISTPKAQSGCFCICQNSTMTLEQKLERIKKLLIDKDSTTKAKMKLQCADDGRPSAKYLGAVGVVLLTFIFSFLILLDFINILQYLRLFRKERQKIY